MSKRKGIKIYMETIKKVIGNALAFTSLTAGVATSFVLKPINTVAVSAPSIDTSLIEEDANPDDIVNVNFLINKINIMGEIHYNPEEISIHALSLAEEVEIDIYKNANNFDFLYYMKNLKKLTINIYVNSEETLKKIDGSKLPSNLELSLVFHPIKNIIQKLILLC